ncbi:unnamed protein product [Ceutorhynchus assimilis]|nr:unnamed protein product [Ceutorhynchus assimilis]
MECILCGKSIDGLQDESVVHKPTKQGLQTICSAAEKRQDTFGIRILEKKYAILDGTLKVKFHKTCRKTYTSNMKFASATTSETDDLLNQATACSKTTRSHTGSFDIRSMCLICNKTGPRKIKQKKEKLTSVQTGSGKNTFKKIIEAAKEKNDISMISKLCGFEDLFAYDAKYHKSCYTHSISRRNIQATKNEMKKSSDQLPQTLSKSEEYFSDESDTTDNENYFTTENNHDSGIQVILHKAAEILKREIRKFQSEQKEFPMPENISSSEFEKQVPKLLLTFMSWLIDDNAFNNVESEVAEAVIPCSIIMALVSKIYKKNYFQFGLGLFIHHTVRSKQLLETLSDIGLSCTYNDVRQLTTALVKQKVHKEPIYIPLGIDMVSPSMKNYIHASMDNFDLNEQTIDGKNTTHSMAIVVFQQRNNDRSFARSNISREGPYSLNTEDLDFPFQNILKYNNPPNRPKPSSFKQIVLNRQEDEIAKKTNLAWTLLRNFNGGTPFFNWSSYNNILSDNEIVVSDIFYLPFLNNPATEYDTIYTSMIRLLQLAKELDQNHIVITADLAIYSKAREILWNDPPELKGSVTLMLGGMHLNMAYIASIGYIFGDGGLTTMLTETDVYAEATCKLMMEGKQYSRAIRGLTLAADALFRLFFKSLEHWFNNPESNKFLTQELNTSIEDLRNEFRSHKYDKHKFDKFLEKIETLQNIIRRFVESGYAYSTFKFWHSFLIAVELLWRLLKSERNEDFQAHLCAVYDTLPYLSAAGRNLYFKWVPVYLSDMEKLKVEVPDMFEFLAAGNFVVKKTNGKKFNCVASDMALEQSINKDCNSSSGIIGFSKQPGALLRWMTTRHILGDYSKNFLEATSKIVKKGKKEASLQTDSRMEGKNEEDVLKILNSIENYWCNPFDLDNAPDRLVNICTGKIVNEEVEKSLGNFLEIATEKVQHILNNPREEDFWKPAKRNKIQTFKDTKVKPKAMAKKTFIGSECMFRRIICAARFQEMDLSNILSYELSSVPASLFHEDGSMRKTTKSDLAKKLESFTEIITTINTNVNSYVIDGMVLIREVNLSSITTFNDFGRMFLGHSKNKRYIAIHDIAKKLGPLVCGNLLAIHCLTGCDTTSAFYKIGKRTAFDMLTRNINVLAEIGNLPNLSEEEAIELSTRYVYTLYKNKNKDIVNLNEMRCFLTSTTNRTAAELPPTDDAFKQHLKRCIYQLKIWYSSHQAENHFEDPSRYGWILEENVWVPVLSTQEPVPDNLRKILSIRCSDKICNNSRCICVTQGLKCCTECKCKSCSNAIVIEDADSDSDSY